MIRIVACVVAAACASAPPRRAGSVIDELARAGGAVETRAPPGSIVAAYRSLVRPVLGSRCPWLPSDSEFLVRAMRSCGAVSSTVLAIARMLEEPDISSSPASSVVHGDRLRWLDPEPRCGE